MKNCVCCLSLLFVLIAFDFCRAVELTPTVFPLEKGSCWVYRGKIKWSPVNTHQVKSKTLTWRMTVEDVIESGRYRTALVTGFPNDVAWYEEGMAPQYSLLVQDDKCLYWGGYENRDQAVGAARIIGTDAENAMSNLNCIIEFPLVKGKKYDAENEDRPDTLYAWYVRQVDRVSLHVKGHKSRKLETRFQLIYETLPDHIIMEFVPGVGITRYVYDHHGTVAFEDLRLIEYDRGK